MKNWLIFIVAVMVAYDLSIHLIFLTHKEKFWLERGINYWPEGSRKKYQAFWSTFWFIALAFLIVALFD